MRKKIIQTSLMNNQKNAYKFSNNDINKFIFLLSEGVYPYEYIDEWENFIEVSMREKETFYSPVNVEVTDSNYNHAKRVYNTFFRKNR